eukprot:TRINITY_DN1163_c1_g1_i1.p2 TRINITY_DN1163_c1_g1~~TRINITY_DN1163_c1_g1_i1.p2  ORF type:complete len:158 (-),score=4.77 TRINITY_DN1163_c1_g1_i1:763-1236(-)
MEQSNKHTSPPPPRAPPTNKTQIAIGLRRTGSTRCVRPLFLHPDAGRDWSHHLDSSICSYDDTEKKEQGRVNVRKPADEVKQISRACYSALLCVNPHIPPYSHAVGRQQPTFLCVCFLSFFVGRPTHPPCVCGFCPRRERGGGAIRVAGSFCVTPPD